MITQSDTTEDPFKRFVELIKQAAEAMSAAIEKLKAEGFEGQAS